MKKKLHIAIDCGKSNRIIYLNKEGLIVLGCFTGTQGEAIEAINCYYEDEEAEEYINKVNQCFDGISDTKEIEKYINHEYWEVREQVAKQGVGLDVLINDDEWGVRYEVAKQGFNLAILINDEHLWIRKEVAKQGYGLDILIDDIASIVRLKVAKQGFGLDILINDVNCMVREEAKRQLKLRQ